jgi:chemotaxis protein MotB
MSARRKRHDDHEEHVNHERWLITYADMITLLMVLFIVLFAIGQTDLKKFNQLKNSFNNSLGGKNPNPAIEGGTGNLDGEQNIDPGLNLDKQAALALQEKKAHDAAVTQENNTLQHAEDEIKTALTAHGLADSANFRLESRGLVVTIVTDQVLFDLGSAGLRQGGQAVLDGMAPALASLPNPIAIEGHTDNQPIHSALFATNWELSTARATSVLRYLTDTKGIAPSRISAAGYADQRPIVPNDTDAHRSQNRRVEVVVLSQLNQINNDSPKGA